jgi:hypothetical protein
VAIPIGTDNSQGVYLPNGAPAPRKKKKKQEQGAAAPAPAPQRHVIGAPNQTSKAIERINDAWFEVTGEPMQVGLMGDLLKAGQAQHMTREMLLAAFRAGRSTAGPHGRRIFEALQRGESTSPYAMDPATLGAFNPADAGDFYAGPGLQSAQPSSYDPIDRREEAKLRTTVELRVEAEKRGLDSQGSRKELIDRISGDRIVSNPNWISDADRERRPGRYAQIGNIIQSRSGKPFEIRAPRDVPVVITHEQNPYGSGMASGAYYLYLPLGYGYASLDEKLRFDRLQHEVFTGPHHDRSRRLEDPGQPVKDLQSWLIERGQEKQKLPIGDTGKFEKVKVKPTGLYDQQTAVAYTNMMVMRNLAPAIAFREGSVTLTKGGEEVNQQRAQAGREALDALRQLVPNAFPRNADLGDMVSALGGDKEKLKMVMFAGWVNGRPPGQTTSQAIAEYGAHFDGWVPQKLASEVKATMSAQGVNPEGLGFDPQIWAGQQLKAIGGVISDLGKAWDDRRTPLGEIHHNLKAVGRALDQTVGLAGQRHLYHEMDDDPVIGFVFDAFRLANRDVVDPVGRRMDAAAAVAAAAVGDWRKWQQGWNLEHIPGLAGAEGKVDEFTGNTGAAVKWAYNIPDKLYTGGHTIASRIQVANSRVLAVNEQRNAAYLALCEKQRAANDGKLDTTTPSFAEGVSRIAERYNADDAWNKAMAGEYGSSPTAEELRRQGFDPRAYQNLVVYGDMAYNIGIDVGVGFLTDPVAVAGATRVAKVIPWVDDAATLATKLDNPSLIRTYTGLRDPVNIVKAAKSKDVEEIRILMRMEGVDPAKLAIVEKAKWQALRNPNLRPGVRNLLMPVHAGGMVNIEHSGYEYLKFVLRAAGCDERTVHGLGSRFLAQRAKGNIDGMAETLEMAEAKAKAKMKERIVGTKPGTDADGNAVDRNVTALEDFQTQHRHLTRNERGFNLARFYLPWRDDAGKVTERSLVPQLSKEAKDLIAMRRAQQKRLEGDLQTFEDVLATLDDDEEALRDMLMQAVLYQGEVGADKTILDRIALRFDWEGDERLRLIMERHGKAKVRKGSQAGTAFASARQGGKSASAIMDELEETLRRKITVLEGDLNRREEGAGVLQRVRKSEGRTKQDTAAELRALRADLDYVKGLRDPFRVTSAQMGGAGNRLAELWTEAAGELGFDAVTGKTPEQARKKLLQWARRKLKEAEDKAAAVQPRRYDALSDEDVALLWGGHESSVWRGLVHTLTGKQVQAIEHAVALRVANAAEELGISVAEFEKRGLVEAVTRDVQREVIDRRLGADKAMQILEEDAPTKPRGFYDELAKAKERVQYLEDVAPFEIPRIPMNSPEFRRIVSRRVKENPSLAHDDPVEQARNVLDDTHRLVAENKAKLAELNKQLRDLRRAREQVLAKTDPKELQAAISELHKTIDNQLDVSDKIPAPFATWQERTWFHPTMPWADVMKYNSGPLVWNLEKLQRAKIFGIMSMDDLTRAYKNMVLLKLSTMIRIVLGDEALRLASEGVNPFKLPHYRKVAQRLEAEGKLGGGVTGQIGDLVDRVMPNNFTAYTMEDDPRHFPKVYRAYVERERAEPTMPVWRDARAAGADEARAALREYVHGSDELRDFLRRRYNVGEKEIDDLLDEWVDVRADVYEHWWGHQTTRKHLFGTEGARGRNVKTTWTMEAVDTGELVNIPQGQDILPPITGRTTKPPIEHTLGGAVDRFVTGQTRLHNALYGTLDGMSAKLRQVITGKQFEKEMDVLRRLRPDADEAVLERIAIDKALEYTDMAMYSGVSTMAESLLRNTVLFLPAYRQFAQYWLRQLALHPLAMGGTLKELQEMPETLTLKPGQSPEATTAAAAGAGGLVGYALGGAVGGLAGAALGGATGYAASQVMPDNFGITLRPRTVMFLTGGTGAADEQLYMQFMPGAGPLITVPAQMMAEYFPETFGDVYKLPGLSFARPGTPVHGVVDKLVYGVTGKTAPRPIGKDPETRKRLEINAMRMAYTRYWEAKREDPAADIPEPSYEDVKRDLQLMSTMTGVLAAIVPMSMTVEDTDLRDHLDTEWKYLQLEQEKGSASLSRLGDIEKEQEILLKQDPLYAKVVYFFNKVPDAKKDAYLAANPEIEPWTTGSYTVDELTGAPLGDEYFLQWGDQSRTLLTPQQWTAKYQGVRQSRQNREASAELSKQLAGRDEWFEKLARKKGLTHYDEEYQLLRRQFEQSNGVFGAGGGYAGRGLYDVDVPTSDLPQAWVNDIDSEEISLRLLTPEQKQVLLQPGQTVRPGLGSNSVQFGLYISRLPYGKEFIESSAAYGPYQKKVAELRAKNVLDLLDVAAFRKNRLTSDDWASLGYRVSDKVIAAQQQLSRIYQDYSKGLRTHGWAWNSQEGMALRQEMIRRQNAVLGSDKEVKAVLGMGVAERLRKIVRVDEPHYVLPTVDPANPHNRRIFAFEKQRWDEVRKEWEKSDKMPGELEKELRPKLSPEMQNNYDEMVRAWSWRQVIGVATQIRDILKNTYNPYTKSKGWSPESKPGEFYAEQLRKIVSGLLGHNQGSYNGQAIQGTGGSAGMFADEWKAYGGDSFITKLIDWTY